jgi:hypothetical protein
LEKKRERDIRNEKKKGKIRERDKKERRRTKRSIASKEAFRIPDETSKV